MNTFVNTDAIVERNDSLFLVILGQFDDDGRKRLLVIGSGHVQIEIFQGLAGQSIQSKDLRPETGRPGVVSAA